MHAVLQKKNRFRIIFVAAPAFSRHCSLPHGVCALFFSVFAA